MENGSHNSMNWWVYTRTTYCPYQARASRVFEKYGLTPREILIDENAEAMPARDRVDGLQIRAHYPDGDPR